MIRLDAILKLVELQFGKLDIQASDRLVEDLGAESADIANLVAVVEEKFGIHFKESEIARIYTPQDLFELVQRNLNAD